MSLSNKDLSKKAQSVLKELGYEVSIGHTYELLSKLVGFNSWNEASAKDVNLARSLNQKEKSHDDVIDEGRKDITGTPVKPLRVSLTASATVEISMDVFPNDPSDKKAIKQVFLEQLQNNYDNLEISLVEPPIAPHDFQNDDIEISEDETYRNTYLNVGKVKGTQFVMKMDAPVKLGKGPNIYEAKLKTQAEAKVYLEIHAETEDQAKELAAKFIENGNYECFDVIGTDDACTLKDWEVTYIESTPYVEYVWKRNK